MKTTTKIALIFAAAIRMVIIILTCPKFRKEACYILESCIFHWKNIFSYCMFPYKMIAKPVEPVCGYDNELQLPYVLHNEKRLYFPRDRTLQSCAKSYKNLTSVECILGGAKRIKQPHEYLSDHLKVENGDVVADIGCAEGLFALDNIGKASRVFLFEGDKKWGPALSATFKDYKDQVVIINKYVSDHDGDDSITLKTAFKDVAGQNLLLKMDIEGAEVGVLSGNKDYLSSREHLKIACCTYHKQKDSEEIRHMYEHIGLQYEYSDGYMYVIWDEHGLKYPYFRHGVIRGWK